MKGKKLNFQQVLKLTQNYMHRRGQALIQYLYPFRTKRGRPKKYPDEIILTLLSLRIARRLSFRDLEYLAVQMFGRENVPDFSTYYYCLKQLPPVLLVDSFNFISGRLLRKYSGQVRFLNIKVKESFRRRVKSELRLKCKELVESDDVYRFRGLIESIFGEIKQDVGSYERTKSFRIAQLFVWRNLSSLIWGFSF